MRFGLVCLVVLFMACKNGKKETEATAQEENSFTFENFGNSFQKAALPYQLSDTGLSKNRDTVQLKTFATGHIIPDSLLQKTFEQGDKIKYYPLAQIEVPKKETYYFIKATSGEKMAAYLVVVNEKKQTASFPFLLPDDNMATTQVSTIDRSYTISRATTKKLSDGNNKEGRDVFVYNNSVNQFTLIMTDLLDENTVLINPIDTLKKTMKFTGDYSKEKNNLVSVRDGRTQNERMVFIHFEKDEGQCRGELKGSFLMTSSNTAVYRQGSDPCVLTLRFEGSSVSLHEENCGNHRDVRCLFEGSYSRKAEPKPKSKASAKKSPSKKATTP